MTRVQRAAIIIATNTSKGVGGVLMRTSFDETKEAQLREALAAHREAAARTEDGPQSASGAASPAGA